jgi:hypothetical protein
VKIKIAGLAMGGVLALSGLTGCNLTGGDDDCRTDSLAAAMAKPGPGGGSGGGAKGGSGSKGGKGSKGKAPKSGTNPKPVHVDDDCDDD